MTEEAKTGRDDYFREAATWADDRRRWTAFSGRLAWTVAAGASIIAVFEAIALVALTPLKTVVPYTLLVDRQTGFIQALKPLDQETVAPDKALTRSLLAQYVLTREGFDIDSLQDDYRKVALWSEGDARRMYVAHMLASSPDSPLSTLPRRTLVQAEIRSISSLDNDTALIRFTTTRLDPGARPQAPEFWASVVKYRFSGAEMSASDRLINPLGFQVSRYRRDAEMAPPERIERSAAANPVRNGEGVDGAKRSQPGSEE